MNLTPRYRIAIALLTFAAAGLGSLSGCGTAEQAASIAKAEAPVVPKAVTMDVFPDVKFVDITESAGLRFVHSNGAAGEKLLPETMGSGVAFLDYDGDGDQDLFLVNSAPWEALAPGAAPGKTTHALYRNDGKGHFQDVTKEAGLDRCVFGMGAAVGDFDNDGDIDLYVTAVGGGILFRNDGGKFADVTAEANAKAASGWLSSAAFFDMENDGDLDLFVCQYVDWSAKADRAQDFQLAGTGHGRAYGPPTAFGGTDCVLLRNDGGKFVDVSKAAGIQIRSPSGDPVGKALGVAPYDIDGDGYVDLAVANDTVQNFLFHNRGDGTFEEKGITSGVAYDQAGSPRGAMGLDWASFKNDETLGLAVGNFANEMMALYVTDEPAGMQFSDLANIHGLGAPSQPPLKFGLFFFDYDLDGRLDLLSANGHLESDISKVQASQSYPQKAQLFWNTGQKGRSLFALVGPKSAGEDLFRPVVGRGSAYADIDGDGDLDVVLTVNGGPARLFRNDGGSKNPWIRVVLRGKTSNRDGIGSKVVVSAGGVDQRRQLFPAKGYLSSVELPLTFGLGKKEAKADSVTVTWPSGKKSELKNVPAGTVLMLEEE